MYIGGAFRAENPKELVDPKIYKKLTDASTWIMDLLTGMEKLNDEPFDMPFTREELQNKLKGNCLVEVKTNIGLTLVVGPLIPVYFTFESFYFLDGERLDRETFKAQRAEGAHKG